MTVAIGKAAVRHGNTLIQVVDQGKHSEQPHVECQPPQSSSRESISSPEGTGRSGKIVKEDSHRIFL